MDVNKYYSNISHNENNKQINEDNGLFKGFGQYDEAKKHRKVFDPAPTFNDSGHNVIKNSPMYKTKKYSLGGPSGENVNGGLFSGLGDYDRGKKHRKAVDHDNMRQIIDHKYEPSMIIKQQNALAGNQRPQKYDGSGGGGGGGFLGNLGSYERSKQQNKAIQFKERANELSKYIQIKNYIWSIV